MIPQASDFAVPVTGGSTATTMRSRAYPGEDPMNLKTPSVVADAVMALLGSDFETGHRLEVKGCLGPFCQTQVWTRAN